MPITTVLDALWRPWIAAIPVAAVVGLAARSIEHSSGSLALVVTAEFCLAAFGCAAGIVMSVGLRPSTRSDAWRGVRSLAGAAKRSIARSGRW
jgi:hypothetical protein